MTSWDVPQILDLLRASGRIALQYFADSEAEHKADNSLVTVADQAIEDFLRAELAPGTDEAILLGEESSEGWTQAQVDEALAGTTWIVDPIDGTAPYANKLPTWGVSLGLMEAGRLTHGAIFLPITGELMITDGAHALYQQATADPATWDFDDLEPVPHIERPYRSTGMVSLPGEVTYRGAFNSPNPVQAIGSAVYGVVRLITGNYISYIARIKLWDLAAGIPLMLRAGCSIGLEDGSLISETVDARSWKLDAASDQLWKSNGMFYMGNGPETVDTMRRQYSIDR